MKIGIDVSRANHEQKTGVEWYAFHLVQELKKIIPEEIQVVLYSDTKLVGELADLPVNWESKVLSWPPKRLWTQLRLGWEMLVNAPDILFIPAHVFPIIHPKKTVMTVHDIAAKRFPDSYNWFEQWYSLWSAKKAVNNLWKVIVPSEFTKQELVSVFGGNNIQVVPHGYSERYGKIENEEGINKVLEKYNIKKPFILNIGRLEEKKNTWRIVKAFDQLDYSDLKLVMIGKPGYGYEKVEQVIKESDKKNNIITPGWVEEEDIPFLMNAAEVFVFPSLYEGFGIPVLEAMACGTPVVASKGNSLEEVGGDACVYVDPQDIGGIEQGISGFLKDKEFCNEKVGSGKEQIKRFSWVNCAEKTFSVLSR